MTTLIFALFSFLGLFFVLKYFKDPGSRFLKIYHLILAVSCVGITLYWGYWGMIGLKLWSY